MKIRNQDWIETNKFIAITLLAPFWSAWKKYNWYKGVEGFGISEEAVQYAIKNKKFIRVHVNKYGTYEIGCIKLKKECTADRIFTTRDQKTLYVLPRFVFERVETFDKKAFEKKEHVRAKLIAETEQKSLI
jgi:hypothetical protein